MQIRTLTIDNFRGIANGRVIFRQHSLLVGGNNIGKSTVCEALDLVLGPERLYRRPVIDEHDFHNGRYEEDNGSSRDIVIRVVLTNLDRTHQIRFRQHLRRWDDVSLQFVDEEPDGLSVLTMRMSPGRCRWCSSVDMIPKKMTLLGIHSLIIQ